MLGRLASFSDDFGNQVSYSYEGGGRLASMTLPGGKKVAYQYDRSNRLSTVTDLQSSDPETGGAFQHSPLQ